MKWFGAASFAAACDESPHVATPVGELCGWCEEPIAVDDDGYLIPHVGDGVREVPYHKECNLRMVVGSVGHQCGECTCKGQEDQSEWNISRREAALRTWIFWQWKNGVEDQWRKQRTQNWLN